MRKQIHTEERSIRNKIKLPKYGIGCANRGKLNMDITTNNFNKILNKAFEFGIKYFDTAPAYCNGLSEHRLGNYFMDKKKPINIIISTKVGKIIKSEYNSQSRFKESNFNCISDYTYDGIMRSFEDSLNRLRLNNVDILYIHDLTPFYNNQEYKKDFFIAMKDGIKALEKLRSEGLVKLLGLGENQYEVCNEAMNYFDFDCFLIAGRYTLFEQTLPESFLIKCEDNDITIIIGGPLNSGLMTNNKLTSTKYNYVDAQKVILEKSQRIKTVCKNYKVNPVAAALQFPLFNKVIKTIIIGVQNQKEIQENITHIYEIIPIDFWEKMRDLGYIHKFCPIK